MITKSQYGELDRLDYSLITSKHHQLRMQGNATVSSVKPTVSDFSQVTLGEKYPFFGRTGDSEYRVIGYSGLITMNFDPTSTFLRLDVNNLNPLKQGFYWGEELIVPLDKIVDEWDVTLKRQRFDIDNPFIEDAQRAEQITGPITDYTSFLATTVFSKLSTRPTSAAIYLERKFREKVSEWLTDGKPKLFRSETEGNIIVMVTDVSLSPLENAERLAYTVTMTMTEVAAFNALNLMRYNLVPDIKTNTYLTKDRVYEEKLEPKGIKVPLEFPQSEGYNLFITKGSPATQKVLIGFNHGYRVKGGTPLDLTDENKALYKIVIPPWAKWLSSSPKILEDNWPYMELFLNNEFEGDPGEDLNPPTRVFHIPFIAVDADGEEAEIDFKIEWSRQEKPTEYTVDPILPFDPGTGELPRPIIIVRKNGVVLDHSFYEEFIPEIRVPGHYEIKVKINETGEEITRNFRIKPLLLRLMEIRGGLFKKPFDGGTYYDMLGRFEPEFIYDRHLEWEFPILNMQANFETPDIGKNKTLDIFIPEQIYLDYWHLQEVYLQKYTGLITRGVVHITPKEIDLVKKCGEFDPVLEPKANILSDNNPPDMDVPLSGKLIRQQGETVGKYLYDAAGVTVEDDRFTKYGGNILNDKYFVIEKGPAPRIEWPTFPSLEYGQKLSVLANPYITDQGVFTWEDPDIVPLVGNKGYRLNFEPKDTENYYWVEQQLWKKIPIHVVPRKLYLALDGEDKVYDNRKDMKLRVLSTEGLLPGDDLELEVTGECISYGPGKGKEVLPLIDMAEQAKKNYEVVLSDIVRATIKQAELIWEDIPPKEIDYNRALSLTQHVTLKDLPAGVEIETEYDVNCKTPYIRPRETVENMVGILRPEGKDKSCFKEALIEVPLTVRNAPPIQGDLEKPIVFPKVVQGETYLYIPELEPSWTYSLGHTISKAKSGLFTNLFPDREYNVGISNDYLTENSTAIASVSTKNTYWPANYYKVQGFIGEYDGEEHGVIVPDLLPGITCTYWIPSGTSPIWIEQDAPPRYRNPGYHQVIVRFFGTNPSIFLEIEVLINIKPKEIQIVPDSLAKKVGEGDPELTYHLVPQLYSGDISTGELGREIGEVKGAYRIEMGTLKLPDQYRANLIPEYFHIGDHEVARITIDNTLTKRYGESDPTFTYTLEAPSSVVYESIQLNRVEGEKVGEYLIYKDRWNLQSDVPGKSYQLIDYYLPEQRLFRILKGEIGFSVTIAEKVYGDFDSEFILSKFQTYNLPSEDASGNFSRQAGEDVGEYRIELGNFTDPNNDLRYFNPGLLRINPKDIGAEDVLATVERGYNRTGNEIRPKPRIVFFLHCKKQLIELEEDKDYTLEYENNIEPGTATIIIKGRGNFTGERREVFYIYGKIENFKRYELIDAGPFSCNPDGLEIRPSFFVEGDDGARLTEGVEYKTTYIHNILPGKAYIIIDGIQEPYRGRRGTLTFNIQKVLPQVTVSDYSDLNTAYSPFRNFTHPTITTNQDRGTVHWTYTREGDGLVTTHPVNIGTYKPRLVIDETDTHERYDSGDSLESFVISPVAKEITTFGEPSGLSKVYSGKRYLPGRPQIDGVVLIQGKDYEITGPTNVVDVGEYEWTYRGIGNYEGSYGRFTLDITPYPLKVKILGPLTKRYHTEDPVFYYEITPLLRRDLLKGQIIRTKGESVGVYNFSLYELNAGPNYEILFHEDSQRHFEILPFDLGTYTDVVWHGPVDENGDHNPGRYKYTGEPVRPRIIQALPAVTPRELDYVFGRFKGWTDLGDYEYENNAGPGTGVAKFVGRAPNVVGSIRHIFTIV